MDDYSRFTWVKFLASKDEAPDFIIKFLKMIQVGVSHETSVARTPQQNGVVERRNRTLVEAARTMLIFTQAPLFLLAEAIATAYNDCENLGKFQGKVDIGIFIGYASKNKAYRFYNRRTRKIIETINVDFDELAAMASEQLDSGPGLQSMTPATSSSGLVSNPTLQQPCNPPPRDDWDHLFQNMFNEYFNPSTIVVSTVLVDVIPARMATCQPDSLCSFRFNLTNDCTPTLLYITYPPTKHSTCTDEIMFSELLCLKLF
ncbi:retrovirus-related pol polyprotein from transposon TNT 1-94 [Tanacetum coccineum]